MTAQIETRELFELGVAGVKIIDVRTPAEFERIHAVNAVNFPLDQFNPEVVAEAVGLRRDEAVYLICKMGGRSKRACEQMAGSGFTNAVNVSGGTDAWVAAGLPVVRGTKQTIEIGRQVQILAGGLAFVGAGLSFYAPVWAGLPALIGAGLVFSGLTGTCAMGTLLAKLPWNQGSQPGSPPHLSSPQATTDANANAAPSATPSATPEVTPGPPPGLQSATTAQADDAAPCESGG